LPVQRGLDPAYPALSWGLNASAQAPVDQAGLWRTIAGAVFETPSAKGSILCFRRDYPAEHLMQHPKQTTRSVLLAFQEQGLVTIVLSQRMGAQNRILAGCGWREGAGIDTSGRKMIPNFNKPAGFDCIVTVGDSAEEGGYVLIDPAQDGKSLTLFIQSPITAENDSPRKATGYNLTLGKEDRTFALTRIDSKACQSFKAVTE
jgi:hypothetical protein